MNSLERGRLAGLMAIYAGYYRQNLSDEIAMMYADDLSDFPLEAVEAAMLQYRKNPRNRTMPLPAMIREIIEPVHDNEFAARQIAMRILGAIPKFGWCNGEEAKSFIGDVGWRIVGRAGGWTFLCEQVGASIDPSIFQAQLRDIARGELIYSPDQIDRMISIEAPRTSALLSVGQITGSSKIQ